MSSTAPPQVYAVFRWHGQGEEEVAVGLSVNQYRAPIPLSRSGQDFSTIVEVPSGLHFYRFLVDGQWKSAEDQPYDVAPDGEVANVLDANLLETMTDSALPAAYLLAGTSPPGEYSQVVPPNLAETLEVKEPPMVPAHLDKAVLNSAAMTEDSILPKPPHVALNHVYSAARTDGNVYLFGTTHRYRAKFVTTVFYTRRLPVSAIVPGGSST